MTGVDGTVVIAGAGQAGGEIATTLRQLKYEGQIKLIGDEPHVPYKRPPLSKAFLAGEVTENELFVTPPSMLEKANIEFIGGTAVTRIDRTNKEVWLSDGRQIGYDKLALATGGRARSLSLPGSDKANIFRLRSIADVALIRERAKRDSRVAIVGGGFVGLEVAAIAIKLGLKVTVLESMPRVLARVAAPEISRFFEHVHASAGVDLRVNASIDAFIGGSEVMEILLKDGSRIGVDFVIAGIGLAPNAELAQAAGLTVGNGIVVDEFAVTSDPDIVAAGDCTNHPSKFSGGRLRLESVQNAVEQARHAAFSLIGKPKAYNAVPWFWSDQYDLKLQMVGLPNGADRVVVRGDPSSRTFSAFYLRDGVLRAVHSINRPEDFLIGKRLVAACVAISTERLCDETVPLTAFLSAR